MKVTLKRIKPINAKQQTCEAIMNSAAEKTQIKHGPYLDQVLLNIQKHFHITIHARRILEIESTPTKRWTQKELEG